MFHVDALDCSIGDGTGSRAFPVDHARIGRDRQPLVERKQWLHREGALSDDELAERLERVGTLHAPTAAGDARPGRSMAN